MLSRPLSSFIAAHLGWRAVFWASAATMTVLAALLSRILPRRQPSRGMHYGQILLSTVRLLPATPIVLRRAIYQGILFAAFNLFWTASPLLLHGVFNLTQSGIALFALAGAGGALAAPLAGRLADRGLTTVATGCAMLAVILSFLLAGWAAATAAMWALVVAAIALDAGTQTNQVVSQRVIYGLLPHARGRINAIYMTTMFMLGATGSALAPVLYFRGGWWLTALTGAGLGAAALAFFTTEYSDRAAGRA
jgi:predicted MFS family arabinose efflux permease